MTQKEQNWAMEKSTQFIDMQRKNIKTKLETIKRQRQLMCQVIEEIEQLWEVTQKKRNEIDYLKKKTVQQEEDIGILTAEKHKQYLEIKRLTLQLENVCEELREKKNEATREEIQLQKICAEIHQEGETLERGSSGVLNEWRKFEKIKYEKTKTQDSKDPKQFIEQIMGEQEMMERLMADSLLTLMNTNKKIMLETKEAKKQMDKNMADIKQELKRTKNEIVQQRDQIEHMNFNINEMKQRWTKYVQVQKATVPEIETKETQKEGKDTYDNMKIKLNRIKKEIEKLWDVLADSAQQLEVAQRDEWELKTETGQMEGMKPDSQKHTDLSMKITQWETEKMCDIQSLYQDIESKMAQVQSERDEIERIKAKLQTERENIERDRQLAKAEMDALKCMRESSDRHKQDLDDQLQRTKKEIKEMEVLNMEIEIKKNELVKLIRLSRRKRGEMNMMKDENEEGKKQKTEWQRPEKVRNIRFQQAYKIRETVQHKGHQTEQDNMETSTKNKVTTDTQGATLETEEISKTPHRMREDTEQSRRQLERTDKERDKLEITKREKEEVEQKLEDAITALTTISEMKEKIQDATAEINNTCEEMIVDQRKMKEKKEEVKKSVDELKARVGKWILAKSATRKTFSVNTFKLQQPQNETQGPSLENQTFEILSDQEQAEDKITEEPTSLQQSVTLEDQRHNEEKKEKEHSVHKQREELNYFAVDAKEKQKVFLQMQTEIHKEMLTDDDDPELAINVREDVKVQKQLSKLKEREERMRAQTMFAIKNLEEKYQEIKRFTMEIDYLLRQRPETGTGLQNTVDEIGYVEQRVTGLLRDIENRDILRVNVNLFKHEITQCEVEVQKDERCDPTDESDLVGSDVEKQKPSQESREDVQSHTEEMDGGYHENSTGSADKYFNMKSTKTAVKKQRRGWDQRSEKTLKERERELNILKLKMQRQIKVTKENMEKMVKVKRIVEKMAAKTRKKSEDIEIIKKETQAKLRTVEDLNCMIEATKQELEKRCVLISKERAVLEKCKTEIRKQKDKKYVMEFIDRENRAETDTETDEIMKNRMAKEMEEMEKEIVRTKSEKEKLEEHTKFILDSLDQKHREIEQLKKEMSEHVKLQTGGEAMEMLRQQIQIEWENVRIARQQAEAELQKMNNLRDNTERQKLELDDRMHMNKREIKEIELLKSELESKKKENEWTLRKIMRKKEEGEIMWKEIQREKESLRRDTIKRRRELDQRLEKTLRERDELEILRTKMHQQKAETGDEKQNKTTLIQVNLNDEKQTLRQRQEVKNTRDKTEMAQQTLKVINAINDLQNMSQKIHVHLELIREETKILENMNVHLGEQTEELKELKIENRMMRNDMSRMKSQIMMEFGKITSHEKTENEMGYTRDDIQKQKQELQIRHEVIKREGRELEVLKSELEIKKREDQKMVRKHRQKQQEIENMWAEVKREKVVLKRETEKRKKELEWRLEMIRRERDQLEIMKQKLQREKEETKSETEKSQMPTITTVPNQSQKNWELVQKLGEKYEHMKKHSEDLIRRIRGVAEYMEVVAKTVNEPGEEIEHIKTSIRRQTERMIHDLKGMQQNLRDLEQGDMMMTRDDQFIQKEKERSTEKSKELVYKEKEFKNEGGSIKSKAMVRQLETRKKNVITEREELELLRKDFDQKKEDIEVSLNNIIKEREELVRMKADADKEREMMLKEKDRMEEQSSELKTREDQLLNQIKSVETLRDKLQQVNERMCEDMKNQMDRLQQNSENVLMLCSESEKTFRELDDQKEKMACCTEMLEKEKESLRSILSGMVIKRQDMENQWKQKMDLEKQGLAEQEMKEDEWKRLNQELETEKKNVITEREELELLRKDLDQKKEDIEVSLNSIIKEREELVRMKADADKEREMMLKEKGRMEEQSSELKTREDQLLNQIKSVETLREKLQQVNERMCEDMKNQMDRLQQNSENVLMMCAEVEEKLQDQKDNMTRCTALLEKAQKGLKSSAFQRQIDRFVIDITGKTDSLENTTIDIQSMNDITDFPPGGVKQQILLIQTETGVGTKTIDPQQSEVKIPVDQLSSVMNLMESLRAKLQQLNQRTHEFFGKNMKRLEQNNEYILHLNLLLECKHNELVEQKNKITDFHELFHKLKKDVVTMKVDKITQTEVETKEWLQDQVVIKQEFEHEMETQHVSTQTEESGQWKLEEDSCANLSEPAAEQDDFVNDKIIKRNWLPNMWRDTKKEQKEIGQMKNRGQEMRNNLEKRLKLINQFVKRTWLPREKEQLEPTSLEQGLSQGTTSQCDCKSNHKMLHAKYTELQQLKVWMLREIEKLQVKQKLSATTSNKANQTSQEVITTGEANVSVTEETSTKKYQETDTDRPETPVRLLSQLRHYCYRYCCPCSACCTQVHTEEK